MAPLPSSTQPVNSQSAGSVVPSGTAYFPVKDAVETQQYCFLLLPEFTLLAFTSAVEPLRIANQLSQKALYQWQVFSEDGKPVCSSSGIEVNVTGELTGAQKGQTLVICSGIKGYDAASAKTLSAMREHNRFGGNLGGICTGAITLARAGLLGCKKFTLHWENQPAFVEAYPDLEVSSRIFEIDGNIFTCGGGAAAIDLMLRIIARDYGEDFSAMVADMCLHGVRRFDRTEQRSSLASAINTRNPRIIQIVKRMHENIEYPLNLDELASSVGYSRRQIERQFKKSLGLTPWIYYRNIRVDHGRGILAESDMSISEVALACGFTSAAHFTRSYKARFGETPSKLHDQESTKSNNRNT
ncbi:MAG: GlxA family transcriptional regulator [Rhodobacteraceae bacterium]|nr:GlxA family transcriptional regulator [Paracoccaceae bacterium]